MAGRPKKPGKRYPCGKRTIGQRQEDIVSTAVEGRMRTMGISRELAKDPNMGSPLGRLLHWKCITSAQADAGYEFAVTMRDYLATGQLQRPSQGKAGFVPTIRSSGDSAEPVRGESKAKAYMEALKDVDLLEPGQESATSIVWDVCISEKDRTDEKSIGLLRCGLNAINRVNYGRKAA